MKNLARKFQKFIGEIDCPVEDRPMFISIAVGYALGAQAPLPSEPTNYRIYYVNNVAGLLRPIVDELNENFLVNTNVIMDIAERTWAMRYKLCHPVRGDYLGASQSLPLTERREMPGEAKKLMDKVDESHKVLRWMFSETFEAVGNSLGALK